MTYGLYFKDGKWADTLFEGGYSNRKNAELAKAVFEHVDCGSYSSWTRPRFAPGYLIVKKIESPPDLDKKILGMIAESVK